LDGGVYTIRGLSEQGSIVIVADGGRQATETEVDWGAMVELSGGDLAAQAALFESTFGKTLRMIIQMDGTTYLVFPERKKYTSMGMLLEEGAEPPMSSLRCVQETPYIRIRMGQGADAQTLVVTSLSAAAEERYFSLEGFQAMPLSELAVLSGAGAVAAEPTHPGLFGRLFRFF